MSFVDVGGVRLNCVEWGRGDITVVFIHGNLACADWFRLAASLLPERFRIVAIDWRDVRDATLKTANTILVDHHHGLKLSSIWGDGRRSSSDGQRFAVERDSLLASFYPRYFGYYDRALALYTHTSDQHSVYATQACGSAWKNSKPIDMRNAPRATMTGFPV